MKITNFTCRALIFFFWIGVISTIFFMVTPDTSRESQEKTLHIYGWPGLFTPEILEKFERESQVKIEVHTYSSNEEMLCKMRAVGSKGYDLIVPSDYAVSTLVEEGLIKPIDHSQLEFFELINPILRGHEYDRENRFAIPYQWEIFGFGIDRDYFEKKQSHPSWEMFFNPTDPNLKLGMLNDPIEAVKLAAQYLFGTVRSLNVGQMQEVRNLLDHQKKWVEAYCGMQAYYLLSTKNCQLAVCTSSYIFGSASQYPHVKFVLPEHRKFISIENMCISKDSTKDRTIYAFLNFIYRPENQAPIINRFLAFPATIDVAPHLRVIPEYMEILENSHILAGHIDFIHNLAREKEILDLWVDIKSKP